MSINPVQLIRMIKGKKSLQQVAMNFLQQNNVSALETLARNLAAQKGLDFDKEFASFKQSLQ